MTIYGVWLEPYETFAGRWEAEARSPAHAVEDWMHNADPPHPHHWDNECDDGREIEATVCEMPQEDVQGPTVKVKVRCKVEIKWTVERSATVWKKVEKLK